MSTDGHLNMWPHEEGDAVQNIRNVFMDRWQMEIFQTQF